MLQSADPHIQNVAFAYRAVTYISIQWAIARSSKVLGKADECLAVACREDTFKDASSGFHIGSVWIFPLSGLTSANLGDAAWHLRTDNK
eukprot:6021154-Karenia_brevis.AAC.1